MTSNSVTELDRICPVSWQCDLLEDLFSSSEEVVGESKPLLDFYSTDMLLNLSTNQDFP